LGASCIANLVAQIGKKSLKRKNKQKKEILLFGQKGMLTEM
jgi:hypothetical protein